MIAPENNVGMSGKFLPAAQTNRRGGTVINVIAAIIFIGLLVLAAWWVIKGLGEATEEYTGAMIGAKHSALSVKCTANMQTIRQNLQIYATTNNEFPASLREFVEWSGNSRLFRCPAPDGAEYIYIPGQNRDMPGDNVLVYEPNAVHDGRCNALRLNGTVNLLGGTLAAKNLTQVARATLTGFGTIAGNVAIEAGGTINLTGPTNIFGDVKVAQGASLEIRNGLTLITGKTTNDGVIDVTDGKVVFQGGSGGAGEVSKP